MGCYAFKEGVSKLHWHTFFFVLWSLNEVHSLLLKKTNKIPTFSSQIDLSCFYKLYKEEGRSPYHPRVMLKAVLYAYMNNIYSCRKIEKSLVRDIHFIWLTGYACPDFITINRFRNRVKKEINQIFTQVVLVLAARGLVSLDVEYTDGTKIESEAVFGQMKADMHYKRFRHFGKDKIMMDFAFFAIAFNLKKMAATMCHDVA